MPGPGPHTMRRYVRRGFWKRALSPTEVRWTLSTEHTPLPYDRGGWQGEISHLDQRHRIR